MKRFLMHAGIVVTLIMTCITSCSAARATPPRIPSEAIRNSSRGVMEHSDFRSVRRRVLEKVTNEDMGEGFLQNLIESMTMSISDFFRSLFSRGARAPVRQVSRSSSSGLEFDFSRLFAILFVLVIFGIVGWLLSRIIRKHQHDPDRGGIPSIADTAVEVSFPPGELTASTYESRALEYAQSGKFALAIRELLLGSMSWIERAGLIRFRKGLTNRDYARAVWRERSRREAWLTTGTEFELVFFGRRAATKERFERCLSAFQGAFREEATSVRDDG